MIRVEGTRDLPLALSRAARLTQAFYSWERRGRGWQLWPYPVELEPVLAPPPKLADDLATPGDDARRPTALGSWLRSLVLGTPEGAPPIDAQPEEPESKPAPDLEMRALAVALPPDVKVGVDAAEHFLLGLTSCRHPASFEIVATQEGITVQFAASTQDVAHARGQLQAHFPEAVISEATVRLEDTWRRDASTVIVDFGLSQEFMQPLQQFSKLDIDPFVALLGAMDDLRPGELVVYQNLFQSVSSSWNSAILGACSTWDGDSIFADAPELLPLAKDKTSRPLFASCVRLAVQSGGIARSWDLARSVGGCLTQFANPHSNQLVALDNEDYEDVDHAGDVLARRSRRTGMLLNSQELLSLVHLPSASVRSEKLTRHTLRTKAAPKTLPEVGLRLGQNTHAGASREVALTEEQRLRHTHVIGVSGTGKSTLLMRMLVQDIEAGRGVAVIDPHGDLIDELLCRVPEARRDDVVLVDPADMERPVPFNILAAHSELEKTQLASDLVSVFRRLSTSWGDQMTSVLSNAVLAFLESSRGGTLADLRRFLIESDYRDNFLSTVSDSEVVYFWQKEFPLLVGRPQAPLLTRLDAFLRPKPIRGMVAQRTSIDFAAVLNQQKLLLVKLSQGLIGEENAALLGSLFVSKLQQTALGRQSISQSERLPFYIYVDEFSNFVTPSLASMLTGVRKYGVGLVLAHQELRQLWNQNKDVAGAVLANAASRVCFRVGDEDAKTLAEGLAGFTATDLQNLSIGQAVCRVDRSDWDFSLSTTPLPHLREPERARGASVVARSREQFGVAQLPTGQPENAPAGDAQQTTTPRPQPSPRTERPRPSVPPSEHPRPGRGGAQHKYLQELVRRWGEANGWLCTVEKSILDGLGSVDIALEREGQSIACEVCVTGASAYEVGNIQKCLAAGYDQVVTIVADKTMLARVRAAAQQGLDPGQMERVAVRESTDVFEYLGKVAVAAPVTSSSTRGYSVTVKRTAAPRDGTRSRSIAKTVAGALARLRGR